MLSMRDFTPCETKIMGVLSDGLRHTLQELKLSYTDEHGNNNAVQNHVKRIREKIRPRAYDIINEYHMGRYYYRCVRLIGSAANE